MKLRFAKIVTAFCFVSTTALAQFVGGGGAAPLQPIKKGVDSPWKNRFCLYAGPSMPIGAWNRDPSASATITDPYTNNTGFGATSGFYCEMASMFYLKRLKLPEEMGVAITTTWFNFSTNKLDWSSLGTDYLEDEYFTSNRFYFYSMKLGLQYSYSPIKKLCFDAYYNIAPTLGYIPRLESGNPDANYDFYTYTSGAWGLRRNIGLNVRYSVFTVGLDFMLGPMTTVLNANIDDNRTGLQVYSETVVVKTRASAMALKLGFTL